ncbi:MAG: hypothetical protein H0V17_36360 [Deltaproteobacteria bacterium]|nr:hypothetical protein [Deltaproteobacteria bacterium]
MSKPLVLAVVLAFGASTLTGCFVSSRPRHQQANKKSQGCGPAHHWDGNSCVHNGKAKGHKK